MAAPVEPETDKILTEIGRDVPRFPQMSSSSDTHRDSDINTAAATGRTATFDGIQAPSVVQNTKEQQR